MNRPVVHGRQRVNPPMWRTRRWSSLDSWRRLAGGVFSVVVLAALAAGAFWVGTQTDVALGVGPSVAHAQATPVVSDRAAMLNGTRVGEVLINGNVVIRMRTDAGGFTAHERAIIIADRLQRWLSGTYSPYDLAVRSGAYGAAEVRAAGALIVTVNTEEAEALGSSSMGLAEAWRDNIMMALGVDTGMAPGGPGDSVSDGQTPGGTWTPSEPYDDKIVPIISLLEGVKIGAARVNGPRSKLDTVNGVAQLETKFQDFLEIDIYVPITTDRPGPGGLDRVQQVGVTGLLDIRL